MALRFRSELDDTPFAAGLRKMESDAVGASRNITNTFSGISSGNFAGAAGALGPGGAIVTGLGAIAAAGDEVAGSMARINASTGNIEQTREVYERLRDVSMETGVAVSESAGMFTRYSIAARQIGATNDEVIKLIELVQKAGVVGGSSAQEIGAASTQLGQALASGKFQGDELRSILENMPLLAEELAKQLGVGVGRLREMGKEGELTTDTVFPALLKSADEINRKFGEMPVTMSRAWNSFKVEAKGALAVLDEMLNVSGKIKEVLEGVRGIAPGDRNQALVDKAIQDAANEEMAFQIARRTPLVPTDKIITKTDKEIADEKKADAERDRINDQLQERSEKYAKEEEQNAQRITDAYHKSMVARLHQQEQLRMKSQEVFERDIKNAEEAAQKDFSKRMLEGQLENFENAQNQALDMLQNAEGDRALFNRMDANQRREFNRQALDEKRFRAREERMEGKQDARFGNKRLQDEIDRARKDVKFAQGEIDKLTAAIEKLIAK